MKHQWLSQAAFFIIITFLSTYTHRGKEQHIQTQTLQESCQNPS